MQRLEHLRASSFQQQAITSEKLYALRVSNKALFSTVVAGKQTNEKLSSQFYSLSGLLEESELDLSKAEGDFKKLKRTFLNCEVSLNSSHPVEWRKTWRFGGLESNKRVR